MALFASVGLLPKKSKQLNTKFVLELWFYVILHLDGEEKEILFIFFFHLETFFFNLGFTFLMKFFRSMVLKENCSQSENLTKIEECGMIV